MSTKTIKIAFVASTLEVGGAENVLFEVITRLGGMGFESALYCLRSFGTVGKRLSESGLRCAEGFERIRRDPWAFVRLRRELGQFEPAVLFLLDHHNAIFWGSLVGAAMRIPRVVGSHTTGRMGRRGSFSRIERLLLRSASSIVALSAMHADYLARAEAIGREHIDIIENGIDVARYRDVDDEAVQALRTTLGIAEATRVVTMVANLRPEKAHEALLFAARRLVAEDRRVRFLIVGDGPRREELETMTAEMELDGNVTFLGERDDIPVILALSDVLVLPSKPAVETLPLAILEAMAAGVPVVASAVGSIPDVIANGVNGVLIRPADADGLAHAVRAMITGSARTSEIATQARKTVQGRFPVERMVSAYGALFERMVS